MSAVSEKYLMVRSASLATDGSGVCEWSPDGPAMAVIDLATGKSKVLAEHAGDYFNGGTLSGDGRFAAFETIEAGKSTSVVVDIETGRRVFELDPDSEYFTRLNMASAFAQRLNHDGSLLLYGDRPMLVYDIAAGPSKPLAQLSDAGGNSYDAEFDPAGDTIYATSQDGTLRRVDARSGQTLSSWPAVGSGRPSVAADGRTILVSDYTSPTAVLLDAAARGDLGDVPTCPGFVPAGSLQVGNGLAAFLDTCDDDSVTEVVDLEQRTVRALPGWGAVQALAVSPDGRSFVHAGAHRAEPLRSVARWPTSRPLAVLVELRDCARIDQEPHRRT